MPNIINLVTMRTIKIIALFLGGVWLFSCNEMIDNYYRVKEEENYVSPYRGRWSGVYTGAHVNGTFKMEVARSGRVEIERYLDSVFQEKVSGYVLHHGGIYPIHSSSSGFTFYGSLLERKGTWKQYDKSGTCKTVIV